LVIFATLLVLSYTVPKSYAQAAQTAGGVDVDGEWFVGEGLKKGDYFEYQLCQLDLNDCAPITMKFWIRGETQLGTESLWDTKVVVEDGSKVVVGSMGLGKTAPEPIIESDNMFHYSMAFKSSLAWLSAFATGEKSDFIHGPKEFRDKAWGKIGAIGGAQLVPLRAESVKVPEGEFESVVVGWYSGDDNRIWVVDDFPFPVKALTYAWVTSGIAPVQFQFELLDYKEGVTEDPFTEYKSTVDEETALGCETDFSQYIDGIKQTNTYSMYVEYAYAPKNPKEGCFIDFKINFKNKYNQNEFLNEVHFDIWVVDDKGSLIRSYADENGRNDIFNGFGLAHIKFPVKEKPGINHYAIFVSGTGPQYQVPFGDLAGFVILDIDIAENEKLNHPEVVEKISIPEWIRGNAKWWSQGTIGDSDFLSGIQFLIKEGIMKIPETQRSENGSISQEIPSWIKNNAGWWADGQIDDNSFVQGIQYLVEQGIIILD